jgi:alpha-glucosidase (family GH31 glycosyl hydrolase)
VWYEALGGASFPGKAGKPLTTAVHLDAIPVFYRGGQIVLRR